MILKINGLQYHCDLISYAPKFESGIEWRSVGSIYVPIDRGGDTKKWSSSIKVTGTETQIKSLRLAIASVSNNIASFAICENYEPIFGSEFYYTTSREFPFFFDKSSISLSTDTKSDGVYSVLSFNAVLTYVSDIYYYDLDTLLTSIGGDLVYDDLNIKMKSINRIGNRDFGVMEQETGYRGFAFNTEQLATEVTYTAKNYRESVASDLATAKAWFINKRTTPFSITRESTNSYLFDSVLSSDSVYVLDIAERENSSGKHTWGEITITYGKA